MNRTTPMMGFLISTLGLAGLMFACAGKLNLPMMWEYLGIYWCLGLPAAVIADVRLDTERRVPGPGGIDAVGRPAATLLFLATIAVAALDAGRFRWSQKLPCGVQTASLFAFMLAGAIEAWAISANPFFSTAIRIQSERSHRVMTGGPYRFIRHPGYLAMAISMPATALALGSLVALVPALLYSGLILWRTLREDAFLKENLSGYSAYVQLVRHRLIPSLW